MPPDSPSTARSKPAWRQLGADELDHDPARHVGVDGQLRRQLEQRRVAGAAGAGVGHRPCGGATVPRPVGATRLLMPRPSPRAPAGPPRPAPATIRSSWRSTSSGRSSRSRGMAMRSRRSSARSSSATNSPSSWSGAWKTVAPAGATTSEPPQKVIDSSTPDAVHEDDEAGRELGVGPVQGAPRRGRPQADLVDRGDVAPRRGRHVDEHLRAVERQQLGAGQVPEVLADADAEAHAEPAGHGTQDRPGREEAALVEQAVRGQEDLAVDVADLALLQQRRRDEQAVVVRLLHEGDDRRQVPGRRASSTRRGSSTRIATSGGEVLEQVAGQAQLRKDDQPGATRARLGEELVVARQVLLESAEARRDLGKRDAQRRHARSVGRQYDSIRTGVSAKSRTLRVSTAAPLASAAAAMSASARPRWCPRARASARHEPARRAASGSGLDELDRLDQGQQVGVGMRRRARRRLSDHDLVDDQLVTGLVHLQQPILCRGGPREGSR